MPIYYNLVNFKTQNTAPLRYFIFTLQIKTMKSLFKFLFYTIVFALISITCIIGVVYIDRNNLIDDFIENAPPEATAFFSQNFKEARMNFAMPYDTRPLVVNISESGSKDIEYQYIYPSQIFYASSEEIQLLFRDSVFNIPNNIGLKNIKEYLQSSYGAAFIYTQNYVINRAAIIGINRVGQQNYNYRYFVRLLNGEKLPISRDIYKNMTKNIELALPEYNF